MKNKSLRSIKCFTYIIAAFVTTTPKLVGQVYEQHAIFSVDKILQLQKQNDSLRLKLFCSIKGRDLDSIDTDRIIELRLYKKFDPELIYLSSNLKKLEIDGKSSSELDFNRFPSSLTSVSFTSRSNNIGKNSITDLSNHCPAIADLTLNSQYEGMLYALSGFKGLKHLQLRGYEFTNEKITGPMFNLISLRLENCKEFQRIDEALLKNVEMLSLTGTPYDSTLVTTQMPRLKYLYVAELDYNDLRLTNLPDSLKVLIVGACSIDQLMIEPNNLELLDLRFMTTNFVFIRSVQAELKVEFSNVDIRKLYIEEQSRPYISYLIFDTGSEFNGLDGQVFPNLIGLSITWQTKLLYDQSKVKYLAVSKNYELANYGLVFPNLEEVFIMDYFANHGILLKEKLSPELQHELSDFQFYGYIW